MSAPAGADDAAWVNIALPLPAAVLNDFLQDVERLLRINPCLDFERLARTPDGAWQMAGRNESNDRTFAAHAEVITQPERSGLTLRYDNGIKRETRLEIEGAGDGQGSVLTISDVYSAPAPGLAGQELADVDRSLLRWAAALRVHLVRRQRWGRVPGYGWLADRVWLRMPPRQRRVAWLIIWTTLLEFVVFGAVLAIYVVA